MQKVYVKNMKETLALGAKIATSLKPGDVVLLDGDLGSGKTTLARGIITHLCGDINVPSPTYTLVQTYDTPIGEIWHCDLYRLKHPDEVYELGLLEAFDTSICLIEWPERLEHLTPKNAYKIDIAFEKDGREVTLSGWENRFE